MTLEELNQLENESPAELTLLREISLLLTVFMFDNLIARKMVINMSKTDKTEVGREGNFSYFQEMQRITNGRGNKHLFRGGWMSFTGTIISGTLIASLIVAIDQYLKNSRENDDGLDQEEKI